MIIKKIIIRIQILFSLQTNRVGWGRGEWGGLLEEIGAARGGRGRKGRGRRKGDREGDGWSGEREGEGWRRWGEGSGTTTAMGVDGCSIGVKRLPEIGDDGGDRDGDVVFCEEVSSLLLLLPCV